MGIKVTPTFISDLLIIEPQVFHDERGFFLESFNHKEFCDAVGGNINFVQDNHSRSKKGVLRGLHYQTKFAQDKLVRVTHGAIFDVAVDLRISSPTYKKWFGIELSAENKKQLWIPKGFAHGFLVISDYAEVQYKTSNYYSPLHECILYWADGDINISWPDVGLDYMISKKDQGGLSLNKTHTFLR